MMRWRSATMLQSASAALIAAASLAAVFGVVIACSYAVGYVATAVASLLGGL